MRVAARWPVGMSRTWNNSLIASNSMPRFLRGGGILLSSDVCTFQIAGCHPREDSSLIVYDGVLQITYRHFRGTRDGAFGYKPEGRGYGSGWCYWIFFIDSVAPKCVPGIFTGVKTAGA